MPPSPERWPDEPGPDKPLVLLRELDRWTGRTCAKCPVRLCGHVVLLSVAMGLKDAPRCLDCLADGLQRPAEDLRDQIADYIQGRDCYRQAWESASDREGFDRSRHPCCLWPLGAAGDGKPIGSVAEGPRKVPVAIPAAATWDAGELSCGDLVLALRHRLNALAPGAVLELSARDPAAPVDLPAWCRLTGHRLLRADHPHYLIQRKEP